MRRLITTAPNLRENLDPLNRRYLVALVGVACLVLLNPILVQPSLLGLTTDAPVINIAGRQRMMSQRLAKAALALGVAETEPARRRNRDELGRVVQLWSASHDGLRKGNPAMSLPGRNSLEILQAFDDLEPYFARMRDSAKRLIAVKTDDRASARVELAAILDAEPEYLGRMDRIVGQFEREARARVDRLLWTGWVVTGLILVALLGIGGWIVRPAARLIRRQILDLREARDALEVRVRERTRELAEESQERSLAEGQHRVLLEQFSHVARTTTIGEMASGLAHELSQPLGAIANYAEGCLVELDAPRPALVEVRSALVKLLATTLRAGQILKRIHRFVTRHEIENEWFEPNRLVEEVEAILRNEAARRGVRLRLSLASDLPKLRGDPIQIQQVLVNFVRNAFDAINAAKPPDPSIVMQTTRLSPDGIEFRVTDNGEGVSPDRLGQIFDAFFSTRAEGMGMGLAISRTIVEAHQGRIAVESTPGVATAFSFCLPTAGVDDV